MPTIDISIMAGNINIIGFAAAPEVNMSATIPTMAATITSGISFIRRLPGTARGTGGGG
ncbi:hypothetical protein RN2511_009570 [Rhodococcus sp. NKCM2511]|jgi:hypothetical protein|nr:hypothetical protein RN2511_009570 [Rhodococcus sp. NKCM2511]